LEGLPARRRAHRPAKGLRFAPAAHLMRQLRSCLRARAARLAGGGGQLASLLAAPVLAAALFALALRAGCVCDRGEQLRVLAKVALSCGCCFLFAPGWLVSEPDFEPPESLCSVRLRFRRSRWPETLSVVATRWPTSVEEASAAAPRLGPQFRLAAEPPGAGRPPWRQSSLASAPLMAAPREPLPAPLSADSVALASWWPPAWWSPCAAFDLRRRPLLRSCRPAESARANDWRRGGRRRRRRQPARAPPPPSSWACDFLLRANCLSCLVRLAGAPSRLKRRPIQLLSRL